MLVGNLVIAIWLIMANVSSTGLPTGLPGSVSCHTEIDSDGEEITICSAAEGGDIGGSDDDFLPDGRPNPCPWRRLDNQPGPESEFWNGHSPADGYIGYNQCVSQGLFWASLRFIPTGAPPPVPAEALASYAVGILDVPNPTIGTGPGDQLAVKVPLWLWIDNPGPASITVTAGTVSVTATATVTSLTWNMGEPIDPERPLWLTPAVECTGLGSPVPAGGVTVNQTPPCGYEYTWMSTKDRTHGTGTWPITVTANWTVTWQSNTGASGTATLNSTAGMAADVGEWTAVLVPGPR